MLVNPTSSLEGSHAVVEPGSPSCAAAGGRFDPVPRTRRRNGATLPELGTAPDFTGTQRWFNTPGGSR